MAYAGTSAHRAVVEPANEQRSSHCGVSHWRARYHTEYDVSNMQQQLQSVNSMRYAKQDQRQTETRYSVGRHTVSAVKKSRSSSTKPDSPR